MCLSISAVSRARAAPIRSASLSERPEAAAQALDLCLLLAYARPGFRLEFSYISGKGFTRGTELLCFTYRTQRFYVRDTSRIALCLEAPLVTGESQDERTE